MNRSQAALFAVLLLCVLNLELYRPNRSADDFKVYDTAARLVREHRSVLIYDGADTGADPQLRHAEPGSVFAEEAGRMGVPSIRMYVYPPLLADLLVPFSMLQLSTAMKLWAAFNVLILAGVYVLCFRLTEMERSWRAAGVLLLGMLTFLPALECLGWGQVSIVLLGLWTAGVFCYARGMTTPSALALALATALKLTPLLVIVPLLLWRDWRWLRAFALGLAGLFLRVWGVNGTACLRDCFGHVIPSMSRGNPFSGNKSLMAGVQLVYEGLRGVNVQKLNYTSTYFPVPLPIAKLGEALGFACMAVAVLLLWRDRLATARYGRTVALALLPLLSTLISPVSWKHAYAVAFLPYAVLWAEAIRVRVPNWYLLLLSLCSVELNWFSISYAFRFLLHGPGLGFVFLASSACGLLLVLYRLGAERQFAQLRLTGLPLAAAEPLSRAA